MSFLFFIHSPSFSCSKHTFAQLGLSQSMKGIKRNLNDFCENTTVHGLAYLTKSQFCSTRIIWSLIVFSAFSVASIFVFQTIEGYNTKFTSTSIETRSIQDNEGCRIFNISMVNILLNLNQAVCTCG